MIIVEVTRSSYQSKQTEFGPRHDQPILIHGVYVSGFPGEVPRQATIGLDKKDPKPYPVGQYVIDDESFYFGKYDKLTIGFLRLLPLSEFINDLRTTYGPPKAA